jgi:hypothetical protein
MTFNLTKILESQRKFRQRLAARPIEEKNRNDDKSRRIGLG